MQLEFMNKKVMSNSLKIQKKWLQTIYPQQSKSREMIFNIWKKHTQKKNISTKR